MKKLKAEQHRPEVKWPTTDLSVYKDVVIPEDLEKIKDSLYGQYLEPYKLDIAPYAMKWIYEAALAPDADRRMYCIERARQGFETTYLAAWAKKKIKVDDGPPMPEDIKQELRELNQKRREEKKAEKEAHLARVKEIDKAEGKKEAPKRSKTPVFSDPDAQKMVLQRYPWVVPGSFKQDPEKAGGTNVDIQCQVNLDGCTKIRTIHLADAFQVKKCANCKSKS